MQAEVILTFPPLYKLDANKNILVYKLYVCVDSDYYIISEHGRLNGSLQVDEQKVSSGKNISKRNETTAEEQAILEACAKWNKKKDLNYVEDIKKISYVEILLPMLAQPIKTAKKHIKYPCYVQPKINGVRCTATRVGDNILFRSRKGKSYDNTLQHLTPHLLAMLADGEIFDGEIYKHGYSLQRIVSLVKKFTQQSSNLEYWVFDMVDTTKPFEARKIKYNAIISLYTMNKPDMRNFKKVRSVYTYSASTPVQITSAHDTFVSEGFEGVIIRNPQGYYRLDYRSYDVIKYKKFIEKEFLIVNAITSHTGRYEGCCIFICSTGSEHGHLFEVCPVGNTEKRKQYYKDRHKYIGKYLTVRFQNLSDDNIPLMPVGLIIRDYE